MTEPLGGRGRVEAGAGGEGAESARVARRSVIITGATGLLGPQLIHELRDRGDTITVLSRNAEAAKAKLGTDAIAADLETPGPWCDALAGVDTIIHLAGEAVGDKRWNAIQKQKIRDSRIETTRTIVEAIGKLEPAARPKALVCASGTDYYPFAIDGLGDDEEVTERDPPSENFLGRVCRDWEKEANAATAHGVRVACLRTGLILGKGLALRRLTKPFRFFVGGRLGSGEQWVSWIGLPDAAAIYATAAHDERYRGPINVVADSIRNREFSKAIGAVLHRPSWLPVPKLAVKIVAGEFAEVVLNGRRVVPTRLRELGFPCREPELATALRHALNTT